MTRASLTRHAAPLRAQAVDAIRLAIVTGEYGPGMRLKERVLCEAYSVSRTVIREALRQLESERLVHIEPQVGPMVASLTIHEARALYEVRGALEATMAKLAARNGTPSQIDRLSATFDEIALAADLSMDELVALKNRLYREMAAASDNPVIDEMLENVQARISQLRRITLGSPDRHRQMVDELGRVLEAIIARDDDAAYAATISHVKAAETIALRALEALDDQDSVVTSHPDADEELA